MAVLLGYDQHRASFFGSQIRVGKAGFLGTFLGFSHSAKTNQRHWQVFILHKMVHGGVVMVLMVENEKQNVQLVSLVGLVESLTIGL